MTREQPKDGSLANAPFGNPLERVFHATRVADDTVIVHQQLR